MGPDEQEHEQVESLVAEGHTRDCAWRIVTGDGECECFKKGYIPGNISRAMHGHCVACGFKECRCR